MKKSICTALLLLSVSFFAYTEEGKMVAVTAEKEVEIQTNDIAAARVAAFSLAVRDAVEKAYGTYVKVEELPDARRIITQASAGLKYTILAEQQRKNRYWVKIQAHVLVPKEYLNEEAEEGREGLGEQMTNFVQKYPQGEINWGDGLVIAYGKGEITETGPNGEAKAARAAEVDAKAHLLEMINDIPVDDRAKTGQDQRMSFALEGFVQGTEVVAKSKVKTTVQVTVQAPIRGVKGVTMAIYGFYTPEPPIAVVKPKPKPPKQETKPSTQTAPQTAATEAKAHTGVVLDARNVSANAALFPKIQDTKKQEVYGVKQVNLDDLKKRGMAAYAVVSRDVQISRMFPNALIIPVRYPSAAESTKRQGEKPFIGSAVSVEGNLQSILVVSEEDALKISEVEEALSEGRVVIVLASEPM